jgi:two-component system NtrC family response regulator
MIDRFFGETPAGTLGSQTAPDGVNGPGGMIGAVNGAHSNGAGTAGGAPGVSDAQLMTNIPTLEELERVHIRFVLERVRWHQGRAAAALGISSKTLYRKIRQYGFHRPSTASLRK